MFFIEVRSFWTLRFSLAVFSCWSGPGGVFFFQAPKVLLDTALSTSNVFLWWLGPGHAFHGSPFLPDTALSTGSVFRGGQVLVEFFFPSSERCFGRCLSRVATFFRDAGA